MECATARHILYKSGTAGDFTGFLLFKRYCSGVHLHYKPFNK